MRPARAWVQAAAPGGLIGRLARPAPVLSKALPRSAPARPSRDQAASTHPHQPATHLRSAFIFFLTLLPCSATGSP
jgi:hypothetical protein